jgi:acyl carrier protein
MSLIERFKGMFGKKRSEYEQALFEKAEAVRASVAEDAPTLEFLKAAAVLVRPRTEEEDSLADLEEEGGGDDAPPAPAGADPAKTGKPGAPGAVDAGSRLLEDLHLGDVEMMELELLVEELFGVRLSRSDLNVPETLGELAALIDKRGGGKRGAR